MIDLEFGYTDIRITDIQSTILSIAIYKAEVNFLIKLPIL
jgi:hypothetical protein